MKYILGIDVGGTKIASGLVDQQFRVSEVKTEPTSQTNLTEQLLGLIKSYKGLDAVGLAMPGPVSPDGIIKRLPNIPNFQPTNMQQYLSGQLSVPVSVLNDAKAFTLAEATMGEGKELESVAGVVLGTGTGVGFIQNKKLLFGKDGLAGEFDHVVTLDGKLFRDFVTANRPFKDAKEARVYLRSLVSLVVLSYNPDLIVLGGGWADLSGMGELCNHLAMNVGGYENRTLVKVSKLKHANIIGAVLPLWKQL